MYVWTFVGTPGYNSTGSTLRNHVVLYGNSGILYGTSCDIPEEGVWRFFWRIFGRNSEIIPG